MIDRLVRWRAGRVVTRQLHPLRGHAWTLIALGVPFHEQGCWCGYSPGPIETRGERRALVEHVRRLRTYGRRA